VVDPWSLPGISHDNGTCLFFESRLLDDAKPITRTPPTVSNERWSYNALAVTNVRTVSISILCLSPAMMCTLPLGSQRSGRPQPGDMAELCQAHQSRTKSYVEILHLPSAQSLSLLSQKHRGAFWLWVSLVRLKILSL